MEYYFDNGGITENLPTQPVNKSFQKDMYVSLAFTAILFGTCLWLSSENAKLQAIPKPKSLAETKEENEKKNVVSEGIEPSSQQIDKQSPK